MTFVAGALLGFILGALAVHLFRLGASRTLREITEQFLTTAVKDLRQVNTEADHGLRLTSHEIHNSVSEMKKRLEETLGPIRQFEKERHELYGSLQNSIREVLEAERGIRIETAGLKKALTTGTGVRGKWGEKVLQEILEKNGFVRGLHFETQKSIAGSGETESRPDVVIHLPAGRLAVDSKEVAGEYLLAQETDDPEQQKEHYEKLVVNIRSNFIRLGRKEYQSALDPGIPFVVMFIPSEAAIRAAFAADPSLFEDAQSRGVILASPMTILPLIYLIKLSRQEHELAQNARELGQVVEDLGGRLHKFADHLLSLRGGLKKAVESWDAAAGSWQLRVAPQLEQVKKLGGRLKETENLTPIDAAMRPAPVDIPEKI